MSILSLAGDIGGTKTILRLVKVAEDKKSFETICESHYHSADFDDLVPMVREFLAQVEEDSFPETACFAIAGPVVNNSSNLTNLNWSLDVPRLEQQLQIKKVRLINDFAGASYGILGLEKSEIQTLQTGKPQENAPIAVIGAGTGLGESFLIPQTTEKLSGRSDYQVFATEGGHKDFAPRSTLEFELRQYIISKYKIDRVSVERIVSGSGIISIYQFLRDRKFAPESREIGKAIKLFEAGNTTIDPAAIISRTALEKGDRLCEETMEMFVSAYGAEAGNVALQFLPYGGIYIAGGIAAKILPLMQSDRFLRAFLQKGRMSQILTEIPVHLILNPQVGLLGSVLYSLQAV